MRGGSTAWHCCLEFFSVSTRLPAYLRLSPQEALTSLGENILPYLSLLQYPADQAIRFFEGALQVGAGGGRVYDFHIAEVARCHGIGTVVTDNRKHFLHLERHGVEVLDAAGFLDTYLR